MTKDVQKSLNDGFLAAVARNDIPEARRLFAQGADINVESDRGDNTLIVAALYYGLDMAAFLISSGIDIDHQNKKGETALIKAIDGPYVTAPVQQVKMARALLAAKANPDLQGEFEQAAIHHAIKFPEILELLLKTGLNIDIQDQDGETALMRAAKVWGDEHSILAVEPLLKAGADPNVRDSMGRTSLMYATYHSTWTPQHTQNVRALIAAGADLDAVDNKGKTALDQAIFYGYMGAIDCLKECALEKEQKIQERLENERAFGKGLEHSIKKPKTLKFK
jgi:ankyrin repeat protein